MLLRYTRNTVCVFNKCVKNTLPVVLRPTEHTLVGLISVRYITKHWDPKWKKFRKEKVIKMYIPDFHEKRKGLGEMSKEEIRSEMKKRGIYPTMARSEMPALISTSGQVIDQYVPPEGDGKFSTISKEGAKQRVASIEHKRKSYLALRKITNYDSSFDSKDFVDDALDIYIKAHEALANNQDDLRLYATEKAIPEMLHNAKFRTIHWKFIESLEPARVVYARVIDILSKKHTFAQITVRFNTQQLLAIYDRFGRLMYGSEILKKDVLEYVVFEKKISDEYGIWRLHAKIIPPWMPSRDVSEKTYVQPPPEPETPLASEVAAETGTVVEINDKQSSI